MRRCIYGPIPYEIILTNNSIVYISTWNFKHSFIY